MQFKSLKRKLYWLPLIYMVLACNAPLGETYEVRPTRTPLSTVITPIGAEPTAVISFDEAQISQSWQTITSGLETRTSYLGVGDLQVEVRLMRVDPTLMDIVVHYDPAVAERISSWHTTLNDAVMITNSGFFERTREPVGMVGINETRIGNSLEQHGGMLTINGDTALVRSLAQVPYDPMEPFDYAIQGRPMLVYPGGFPVSELEGLPEDPTRRTAVGQDEQGRLIFIVIDFGAVTIFDFRDWLAENSTALGIHAAFNLDGGGSTGLSVDTTNYSLLIDSQSRLYSVIAVYPR